MTDSGRELCRSHGNVQSMRSKAVYDYHILPASTNPGNDNRHGIIAGFSTDHGHGASQYSSHLVLGSPFC